MQALEQRIGYSFQNKSLLTLALTHPSITDQPNNQRLEFLGDSILGAVVAHILYDMFPDEPEGALARRLAGLIRGETLTHIAKELQLGKALIFGLSEQQAEGHNKASNLEDALEALIGAIYLDGGMAAAEAFIRPRWSELAQRIISAPKDAKTTLQEWAQGRGLPIPSYRIIDNSGPAHAPVFTIEVLVEGQPPAQAQGSSKRAAEQDAAKQLLQRLNHE
jgi:ribonuclease III